MSEAATAAAEHIGVIRMVAERLSLAPAALLGHVTERFAVKRSPLAAALKASEDDHQRARMVGIAAALEAHAAEADIPTYRDTGGVVLLVESLSDPLLRDTLYRHYWYGESVEEVAQGQSLRTLTIRQNLKRAIRMLDHGRAEARLAGWKSVPALEADGEPREKLLLKALGDLDSAKALKPIEESLLVHACAAVAAESASRIALLVGPRSIRTLKGRPWIEQPTRVPLHEERRIAAETQSPYMPARLYTVMSPEQDWSVRVSVPNGELGIFWLGGRQGVAVVNAEGAVVGVCSEESPSVTLTLAPESLPCEITLRAVGTLD